MKIQLKPTALTPASTSGSLLIEGQHFCYWLTLPWKDGLPGSAIPPGTYSVIVAPSPKFQHIAQTQEWFKMYAEQIPRLMGITDRSNILIHPGNKPGDTDGCILVGYTIGVDFVGESRKAFSQLQPMIVAACAHPLEGCELEMLNVSEDRATESPVEGSAG